MQRDKPSANEGQVVFRKKRLEKLREKNELLKRKLKEKKKLAWRKI